MTTLAEFKLKTPCEILEDLRFARYQLMAGQATKNIRFRSATGHEEEIEVSRASSADLNNLITQYEGLCEASKGNTRGGRRFITFGNG